MEDINKFLRANKILLSAVIVLLFIVFWSDTYYQRLKEQIRRHANWHWSTH